MGVLLFYVNRVHYFEYEGDHVGTNFNTILLYFKLYFVLLWIYFNTE
jgi:hypothetical protein